MFGFISYATCILFSINCLNNNNINNNIKNRIEIYDNNSICNELKDANYRLFNSKTNYQNAINYINNVKTIKESETFGQKSLEEEHRNLVSNNCEPITFYFVGRHAARYPDSEKISKYNSDIIKIRDLLGKQDYINNCKNGKFEPFLQWKPKMFSQQDNLITGLGDKHEQEIAKRFKSLYPKLFSIEFSNISYAVTEKIRTSQTGATFLKHIDGFYDYDNKNNKFNQCKFSELPTNEFSDSQYNVDNILNNICYKELKDNYQLSDVLEFHLKCKKISGNKSDKQNSSAKLLEKNTKIFDNIIKRISNKLGFLSNENDSIINKDLLDSIYNMCRFELAFQSDSIWCKLFDKKDFKYLEYYNDIKVYYNSYGPNSNVKQSCPLIKNLLESLEMDRNNWNKQLEIINNEVRLYSSYFYFTHEGVIKKLLPTLSLFKDDLNFSEESIQKSIKLINNDNELDLDKNQQWRLSLIGPFSANLAFIQYKCQNKNFKIITTVNERPVKVGGCDNQIACDSDKFSNTYGSMREDCDLNKICKQSKE